MAAAGTSRFAVTCGLLRQYMMEQQPGGLDGAFRLLPLLVGADRDEDTVDDGKTMQLFPTRAGTLQPPQERLEKQATVNKAPLTIFYEGRVLVFADFPADQAEELMKLAGSGSSAMPQNKGAPEVPVTKPAANPPAVLPDLPIARKASLQRFLQKRKQRINTTEPYNKVMTAASPVPEKDIAGSGKPAKDEPAASWLGL